MTTQQSKAFNSPANAMAAIVEIKMTNKNTEPRKRKVKNPNCHAKTYTMINPDGEEVTFTNMKAFCKDNDLCVSTLGKVYRGTMESYRDWKSTNKAHQLKFINKVPECKVKTYCFNNPQGDKITIEGLAKFCVDYGLDANSMHRVHNGLKYEHKGWTKFSASDLFKKVMRA